MMIALAIAMCSFTNVKATRPYFQAVVSLTSVPSYVLDVKPFDAVCYQNSIIALGPIFWVQSQTTFLEENHDYLPDAGEIVVEQEDKDQYYYDSYFEVNSSIDEEGTNPHYFGNNLWFYVSYIDINGIYHEEWAPGTVYRIMVADDYFD